MLQIKLQIKFFFTRFFELFLRVNQSKQMYNLYTQLSVELIFTPCFNLEDSLIWQQPWFKGWWVGFHF